MCVCMCDTYIFICDIYVDVCVCVCMMYICIYVITLKLNGYSGRIQSDKVHVQIRG